MGNGWSSAANYADPDGNRRRLDLPARAADLMIGWPGRIVCLADHVRRHGRLSALRADEELTPGRLYLTFPAERRGCRASAAEMEAACRKWWRKGGRRSNRVFPVAEEEKKKRAKVEVSAGGGDAATGGLAGRRTRTGRDWKPALETINEAI